MFPIVNFYKFTPFENLPELRIEQERLGARLGIKGTILLAPEGINAALSASRENLEEYLETLRQDSRFDDLRIAWSEGKTPPFRRLKVKVKDYIVVFDPEFKVPLNEIRSADPIDPAKFHEFLKNKPDNVVFIDTRNYYEYDYGTFKNAEHLDIRHFRHFPKKFLERYGDQKDKTYLMFCTGGIRCEKAAVFAKRQGFEKVYQLDGGILKYFEDVGRDGYQGSCFVFDHRWAVTPELKQSEDGPHPDQLNRVHTIAGV